MRRSGATCSFRRASFCAFSSAAFFVSSAISARVASSFARASRSFSPASFFFCSASCFSFSVGLSLAITLFWRSIVSLRSEMTAISAVSSRIAAARRCVTPAARLFASPTSSVLTASILFWTSASLPR